MPNCHHCGFGIDPGLLAPTHCPQCHTELAAAPGAPPPFVGGPDASFQAPVVSLTDAPASPTFPGDPVGVGDAPLSIELGDVGDTHASGSGPALGPLPTPPGEGAFSPPPLPSGPAPSAFPPPSAGPPPLRSSRPAVPPPPPDADPADSMPGVAEFNLSGLDSPSLTPDNLAPNELDLPQPVEPKPRPTPASSGSSGVVGLPEPVELNLPAPVELDLPGPVELNLPTPAQPVRVGAPVDLHANLPTPVELDLPVPVDLDLPTPVQTDLLTPVAQDLLTPAAQGLEPAQQGVQPAHLEVEPSHGGLEPAQLGMQPAHAGLEPAHGGLSPAEVGLQPAALGLEPAHGGLSPVELGLQPVGQLDGSNPMAAAAAAAASVGTDAALPPPTRTPSPANKSDPRAGPSRGALIGLGGVLVVALAGVGLVTSGVLDAVDDPQPASLGQGPTKPKQAAKGPAVERSADLLAKLGADTPAAYVEAIALAEGATDTVGAAEAAILLHFRFGPDPDLAANAAKLVAPYAKQKDAFVQRVVGLLALGAGQLDRAEPALVGDDVRTRLYRGWLRLAQGRATQALTEAQAVVLAVPNDVGALCLKLAAQTQIDPSQAQIEVRAALEARPAHVGLQRAQVRIAIELGQIALARKTVAGIALPEDARAATKAHLESLRGDVAEAGGRHGEAADHYNGALTLLPGSEKTSIKYARALVRAHRFAEAEGVAAAMLRLDPSAVEAHLLAAEIAIAGGASDRATKMLATLGKALTTDPRVPYLVGQVHAMKLEVADAQAQFAVARERDATFFLASIDEAALLVTVKQNDAAMKLLDDARVAADEAGRTRDVVTLYIAKARLLADITRRKQAIVALTAALALAPTHNEAQVLRATLRIEAGQVAEGEADLHTVFERTGGFPGLARPLGMVYLRDNRVADLETLIGAQLDGTNTPGELVALGARLRLLQGKVAEAKTLIGVALANNPSDWEAQMLLSEAFIQDNDVAAALLAVEKSRPLVPQAELMLQKGRVYEFNGRHADARPLYYKATQLDPQLHEARFLYGRALQTSGQYAGAIKELTAVVAAEGAKGAGWYAEAWMHLGIAQGGVGKSSDAIASLAKATALNDQLGKAFAKLGELYERDSRHARAIKALLVAVELGTSADMDWYPDALMNLGRAQQKIGKVAQARATFKLFLDVAPAEHTGRIEARRIAGL